MANHISPVELAIQDYLRIALEGLDDPIPVSYPNIEFDPREHELYISMQVEPTGRVDDTLDGAGGWLEGFIALRVVSQNDLGATPANRTLDLLADLFPYGMALPVPDSSVTIEVTQPPEPTGSFPDGGRWHSGLQVNFEVSY